MRIALYQPEIAGNVGTILRTAACLGVGVDLIEPMGFPWSDRALRRSGMDYLASVAITRHVDWDAFAASVPARVVLLTTRGAERIDTARFQPDDVLLFGSEGAGVPEAVHARADLRVAIPMVPGMRSLNLAIACALVTGEALRQTGGWPGPFPDTRL